MLNIKNNAKSTVITTEKFLVGKASSEFLKLAEKYNGKISIVKIDGNTRYRVILNDKEHKENAEKMKKAFMRAYNKAQKEKPQKTEPKKQNKKDAKPPKNGKGASVKSLSASEKHEIRSQAWAKAKGDRAKYNKLCLAKGVDNHR